MLKASRTHRSTRFSLKLLVLSLLVLVMTSCGSANSTSGSSSNAASTPSPAAASTRVVYGPVAATPTLSPSALHGPTNFQLITPLNFSSVKGVTIDDQDQTTSLDSNNIKTNVTTELKHLLFVVDKETKVVIYAPGADGPINAKVTQRSDGSTAIDYTQTANSDAGTVTVVFDAAIAHDKIVVRYEQVFEPSVMVNAQKSDVTVAFTTRVKWVATDQIPTAPGNGKFSFTGGGIVLSWTAGLHATAYNVYRQISDVDQQFKQIATVKATSYTDTSAITMDNIHSQKGVRYAIFAVGPTGVENPGAMVIPITTS